MPKELTDKQIAFVNEYCSNGFNAAQAYKIAYPNCKAGHNGHGSRLVSKGIIKQAVRVKIAEQQAEIGYNYDIAIQELDKRLAYIEDQAASGNIQAIQAQTAILREKNAITGLHKQEIKQTGQGLTITVEPDDEPALPKPHKTAQDAPGEENAA